MGVLGMSLLATSARGCKNLWSDRSSAYMQVRQRIHTEREREREIESHTHTHAHTLVVSAHFCCTFHAPRGLGFRV